MWKNSILDTLDRKKADITFSSHVFDRKSSRNLDLKKVEETVRFGIIFSKKCEEPNKLCFSLYFGKENTTYIAITRVYGDFIEVKTAWTRNGR